MRSEQRTVVAHSGETRSSADAPIFIVGMSRSGTTLLSRMLDAHSEIAIFPETWWYVVLDRLGCLEEFSNPWQTSLFFNEVWANLKSYRDPAARVLAREAAKAPRYVGPTARVLEKIGRAYAEERQAKIWGEKTPGHALWLSQIHELFPQARVLFMVRDPRDVLVSYDDRWNAGRRDSAYLMSASALLRHFLSHLLHRPGFPPEQIRWVKYETLAAQPTDELQRICSFLGVEFEPSMLDFHRKFENVEPQTAELRHHALLSQPATADHVGRYKKVFSPSQIALVEQFFGGQMSALGYPVSNGDRIVFSQEEETALAKGEIDYQRMVSGEIRKRFRKTGKVKLRAYRIFGSALDLVPSWRVAKTERDWQSRALESPVPKPEPVISDGAKSDVPSPSTGTERSSFQREVGRIARQSGIVFAGTIFTALLGYGFKVYLARWLGAEALGLYALGITMVSFLGIFTELGIPESAVRFVASYSAQKRYDALRALLWNGAWILTALSLLASAIFWGAGPWVAAHFYHSPQLARYLPMFLPMIITGMGVPFFGNVLSGYREVGRRTMITRFVSSPVTMVLSVLLISLGAGLWGYLAAQVVSSVLVMVLLIWTAWELTPIEARSPDLKKLGLDREVWSFAAAMFGVGLMQFFIGQTDRVALGVYRGAREVGVYAVAAGLVAYETIILQSVNQIFAPVIADIHTRGEHALLGRLFQTLTKWMLGLTFPLAIVMIVFARPIMSMFGHEFEAGWAILVIGTVGQLVNCGVGSVGYLLLMSGNQNRLVRVQALMAAVMVVLTFELVPHWGALGAAIAAAITNVGMNMLNLLQVRKAMKLSPYNFSYWKLLPPIGSAAVVTLLASWASVRVRAEWALIAGALILSYLGFLAVALMMGLDADDRLISDAVWARARVFFGR